MLYLANRRATRRPLKATESHKKTANKSLYTQARMYFNGNRSNNSNKINVPCRYYQQGTCRNGNKCRYLHTDNSNISSNNAIGSRFDNSSTNNQQSSAFGNPNFSKPQSQSAFGSNPFAATPNSNPFGGSASISNNSNASPFGAGGNSNANPFGAGGNSNANPFGAGGNTNANPFGGNTTASVFGNQPNAQNSSAFSNTGSNISSAFGGGAQASPFGSNPIPNTQSAFGTNPVNNNAASSAFGNANAFAANPFSSTNQSSIATNPQLGISNAAQQNAFGGNVQQTPVGTSSSIPQTSAFGQTAPQGSPFGFNNNNTPNIFGNNEQQSTNNNAGGFGFNSGAQSTNSDPLLQGPIPDDLNQKTLIEIDPEIMSVPENVMNAFRDAEFKRGEVPEIAPSSDLCF